MYVEVKSEKKNILFSIVIKWHNKSNTTNSTVYDDVNSNVDYKRYW